MAQPAYDASIGTLEQLHKDLCIPLPVLLAGLNLTEGELSQRRGIMGVQDDDTAARLRALVDLRDGLFAMFASQEGVREWMRSELRYLHWRTPEQVIHDGEPQRAYAAFQALASGIFL